MKLACKQVVKKYYKKVALDGVNFTLEQGKIYALLGPNGSGKSTIMKIIAGLSKQSSGEVLYNDVPISWRTKAEIAYMPTEDYFYTFMKVKDAGKYYDEVYEDFDLARFSHLLDEFDLPKDRKIKVLSSGMKAKLKIALALSRTCPVALLDEPMNGIDLVARDHMMQALIQGFDETNTVVISSHMVDELEKLVDQAIFMKDGKVILEGNVEDIRSQYGKSLTDLYRELYA